MSKCFVTDGKGIEALKLIEKPDPGPLAPADVLVEVRAVSLNYRDLLVAEGKYGGEYDPPIIACSDMSGVVLKTGKDTVHLKPGDKVFNAPFRFWPAGKLNARWIRTFVGGLGVDGVLIEKLVYPAKALVKMPSHMDFTEGATLTIAGLTAWSAVVTHGRTKPGEWVLVHGTGGVSVFGAQIARALGAGVILSTASEQKAKQIKEKLGIDAIINYKDENWPERVREITGGEGVDVVVEVAGGETLVRSIQACGYGARVGVIGILDNPVTSFKLFDIVRKQITLRGIFMESTEQLRAFARACESSELRPWIDKVFPFQKTVDAYRYLQSQQHIGKVVIRAKEA